MDSLSKSPSPLCSQAILTQLPKLNWFLNRQAIKISKQQQKLKNLIMAKTFSPYYDNSTDTMNRVSDTVTAKQALAPAQTYWQGLISGSMSGIVYTLVGFPFDTLKVRIQMNNQPFKQTLTQLIRQGRRAVFSGMSFPLYTVTVINSIVYAAYEGVKKFTNSYGNLTFWNGCWAGAFAGFASSWLTGPVELIKCLMQNNPKMYQGSIDCLKQVVKANGVRGLFVGMFATQVRDIAYFMGQFSFYEYFKQLAQQYGVLNTTTMLIIGGLTGISSWIISYPQDIIKTKIQVHPVYEKHRFIPDGGFIDCAKRLYQKDGFRAFTRGLGSSLLGNVISNATSILVYDMIAERLNTRQKLQN